MCNPVNKIILGLVSLLLVLAALVLYFKPEPQPPMKIFAIEKVAEKKERRKIKRTFTPEGKVASEEVDEFLATRKSSNIVEVKIDPVVKNYLLGVTIGYDFDNTKFQYNLLVGKAILTDLYAVAKINKDLSKAEAGIIWVH